MLKWNVSKSDFITIHAIAIQASQIATRQGQDYPVRAALMDIAACHCNGCPLRLTELLSASPFDFTHDVFGIAMHLNRSTGQLEDCFLPRYAA